MATTINEIPIDAEREREMAKRKLSYCAALKPRASNQSPHLRT
jgi:hypothetical protein